MAYNNSYQFSPYRSSQWSPNNQRDGYNRGFNRNGNYQVNRSSGKRRSHVRLLNKDNAMYLTGWKVGKRSGFRSFFVAPAKNPKTFTSKAGKVWHTCKVIVENKTHGSTGLFPAMWHEGTNRVFCKALGLMFNPGSGFISYFNKK